MTPIALSITVAIGVLTTLGALVAPDGLIILATGGTLALMVALLWGADNIPIYLMPLSYQWTQVSIKPIETVLLGVPLQSLSDFGPELEPSVYLSLSSLAAMSVGLRLGLGPGTAARREELIAIIRGWTTRQGTSIAVGLVAAGYLLSTLAFLIGPLRQPLLAFASVKMIGLFLLTFWSLQTGRGRTVLVGVVAFEVLTGITGFFAGFRESLFVLFLGVISAKPNLKPGAVALAGGVFALASLIAIFWTAVKPDYRRWVSGGGGEQIIVRPLIERFDYISDAAMDFNADQFAKGLEALAARQSYVDFIAAVIVRVPQIIPHQDGRQLGDALFHVVTPRALFPDKPPTPNDSDVTAFYTGLRTNNDANASISIGYVGELYVDFGFMGAIVAAGLIGLTVGWSIRRIALRRDNQAVVAYSLLLAVALPLATFETALIKLIGSVVTAILAAWALSMLTRSPWLRRFLRQRTLSRALLERS